MPPLRSSRYFIILAAAALAACHDSTGPQGGASLRFSGAANATDTVGTPLSSALVVEVHDSTGSAAPAGTVVRFTSVPTTIQYRGMEALVEPLTSTYYSNFASGLTDAQGKTGVLVQLGTVAGPARLVVSVPTLGLEDTVRFTVSPGNAYRVLVTPSDTSLYVGKSFTLRGGIADRWGNPRPDPVTWSSSSAGLSVTSAGVVTAAALGRYRIRATGTAGGTLGNDSGWVSVVPPGRFVATAYSGMYQGFDLFTFDVDGANQTKLASVTDGGIGVHPRWIPGTSTVVYTAAVSNYQTLYSMGTDGVAKLFFANAPPNVTHQAEPTPTADGKWLYFSAYDTQCSQYDYCVARAKIDGSAYELLVATASRQPSPSPDGAKVAYMTPGDQQIRVLDVATKTTSSWSVSGTTPAWSPDGTTIAYRTTSGGVALVRPDGTGQPVPTTAYIYAVFGWSPDSRWIIANQMGYGVLIDAATGTTLPLAYASGKLPASMK